MEELSEPPWLNDARRYYSESGRDASDPVTVFFAADEEVGSERPGTRYLELVSRTRSVHVLDAAGQEQGIIHAEGLVPGVRYVMCRNGDAVWVLTVRSIVRRRHTLEPAGGERWTFDTPFFLRRHVTGTSGADLRLLGQVGPTMRLWFLWVEPGRDTHDLLAAVAFMHRNWWRW